MSQALRRVSTARIVRLSCLLAMTIAPSFKGLSKNDSAVDLSLRDTNGKRVRLRDYRGSIVLLNFWATWCGPCRNEIPMLTRAEQEYRGRVIFVGASLDDHDTQGQVPAFVSKYQIAFPIWMGATADHLAKFDLGEAAPATAFHDRDGRIVFRILGEMRPGEIKERLEWLLSPHSESMPERLVRHL